MKTVYSKFLRMVAKHSGFDFSRKRATTNPMDNSMFREMVYVALRHLEEVSVHTMDWKLTAITKLLQSWVDQRESEQGEEVSQPDYSEFNDISKYL